MVIDDKVMSDVRKLAAWYAKRIAGRSLADVDDLAQTGLLAIARMPDADTAAAALLVWTAKQAMRHAMSRRYDDLARIAAAGVVAYHRDKRGALTEDEVRDIRDAVATLEPPLAEIMRLHYLEGLDQTEVGKRVGLCRAKVCEWIREGKARLMSTLGPSYLDEFGRSVPLRDPKAYRAKCRAWNSPAAAKAKARYKAKVRPPADKAAEHRLSRARKAEAIEAYLSLTDKGRP